MSSVPEGTSDLVLRHYEHLADLSGKMLRLAQNHDWAGVVSLGTQYRQGVETLRTLSGTDIDDPETCHALLSKILSDDALLRELAMPELARLGNLLGNLKRQQSLHQAYGPHQAA